MPKQKDGKNWKVDFTVTKLSDGEKVTSTQTFRVRADAYTWVENVARLTVEAGQVKEPSFKDFTYKVSKLGETV